MKKFFVYQRAVLLSILPTITIIATWFLPFHSKAFAQSVNYVARPFRYYYWKHQGNRILGLSQSSLLDFQGYQVQYFEKGRIEDHSQEVAEPAWQLMYGRLTVDLMEQFPFVPVSGTSITYGDIKQYTNDLRPIPQGATPSVIPVAEGLWIPFHPQLNSTAGYVVPQYFWNYINRSDLFPGGWLHDVGLPLSNAFPTTISKDGETRTIMMQPFERSVLTYDTLNPTDWQVERANIGTDYLQATGQLQPPAISTGGAKRIEVSLAEQWLYAFEGDQVVYDTPVTTGKNGFETPRGKFAIQTKLPIQTMRGSAKGEKWVVPNVPHVMYFYGGDALHGTYWHNAFGSGRRLSHGCVNLPLDAAAVLYEWAPLGTPILIY